MFASFLCSILLTVNFYLFSAIYNLETGAIDSYIRKAICPPTEMMYTSLVCSCVIHIILIVAFDGWLLFKVFKWAMAYEERKAKK